MRKIALTPGMACVLISISEGFKRAENFLSRPLGALIVAEMVNAFEGELTLTRKGWDRIQEAQEIAKREREVISAAFEISNEAGSAAYRRLLR